MPRAQKNRVIVPEDISGSFHRSSEQTSPGLERDLDARDFGRSGLRK